MSLLFKSLTKGNFKYSSENEKGSELMLFILYLSAVKLYTSSLYVLCTEIIYDCVVEVK